MKLSKQARKVSKQLFQLCLVENRVSGERVQTVSSALISKKPRDYLSILKPLHRLLRLETAKSQVLVESAVDLTSDEAGQISADLKARHGDGLTTEFKTNPILLGGLRIRIGSDVFDGSVQGRLERLEKQFAA